MKALLILLILFPGLSFSAPHPATGTSSALGQASGRYFSQHGFRVSLGDSDWRQVRPPREFKNIEAVYKGKASFAGMPAPSLTVRRDHLKKRASLESYVKRWMKDYHRFGFEVLASKKVKVGTNIGYMLDLNHPDSAHQLRQVVFVKSNDAIIFTCRDGKKTFLKNLKACNQIVRTFDWTI